VDSQAFTDCVTTRELLLTLRTAVDSTHLLTHITGRPLNPQNLQGPPNNPAALINIWHKGSYTFMGADVRAALMGLRMLLQ
jgi:hypothetical protein